jgi:hypothetical protein
MGVLSMIKNSHRFHPNARQQREHVAFRTRRDATLETLALMLPRYPSTSAPGLPKPEGNGVSYLKSPLSKLK